MDKCRCGVTIKQNKGGEYYHPTFSDPYYCKDGFRAEPCPHLSYSGIDRTELNDPSKVWRCDQCGVRTRFPLATPTGRDES